MKARVWTLSLMISAMALLQSCGGTSVGNPQIRLESLPYGNGTAMLDRILHWMGIATAFASPVTDLKLCITQIKLKNESGNSVGGDSGGSIEAVLGLIDISNSNVTHRWGDLDIPGGFKLGQLDIELHRDPENCSSANYSIRYEGNEVTKDLELHFEFNPPVDVDMGDVYKLGLSNIATALEQARANNQFNDQYIDQYLTTSLKGSGSE